MPVRARALGIPFSGSPGPLNAITDVAGVEVGYTTLWSGNGALRVGEGPVRTGVTAILPRGKLDGRPCFGGSFALNAAGEMTGLAYLEERGILEGPILITNTHSVGVVRDATIQWMRRRDWHVDWVIPVVGETYDGRFNDIDGGHVQQQHVFQALDGARAGQLAEGSVGGGTGMICYWYKGGTGTASRRVGDEARAHTVGVLVQANYGQRRQLRIAGLPIGSVLSDDLPRFMEPLLLTEELRTRYKSWCGIGEGSIIVVVATDAPLLPNQLQRLAKRPALAIGRLGGIGAPTSGDIFVAFSTANAGSTGEEDVSGEPINVAMNRDSALAALFEATIDATEEAIVNALVAAESAEGANRLYVPRLPHARVQEVLHGHDLLREDVG